MIGSRAIVGGVLITPPRFLHVAKARVRPGLLCQTAPACARHSASRLSVMPNCLFARASEAATRVAGSRLGGGREFLVAGERTTNAWRPCAVTMAGCVPGEVLGLGESAQCGRACRFQRVRRHLSCNRSAARGEWTCVGCVMAVGWVVCGRSQRRGSAASIRVPSTCSSNESETGRAGRAPEGGLITFRGAFRAPGQGRPGRTGGGRKNGSGRATAGIRVR